WSYDSALLGSLIVEMNIGLLAAMQKFQCCDAARRKMHGAGKNRLTFGHSCRRSGPRCWSGQQIVREIAINPGDCCISEISVSVVQMVPLEPKFNVVCGWPALAFGRFARLCMRDSHAIQMIK